MYGLFTMKNNANFCTFIVLTFAFLAQTGTLNAAHTNNDQVVYDIEIMSSYKVSETNHENTYDIEIVNEHNVPEDRISLINEPLKHGIRTTERGVYIEGFARVGTTREGTPCSMINRYYLIPAEQRATPVSEKQNDTANKFSLDFICHKKQ